MTFALICLSVRSKISAKFFKNQSSSPEDYLRNQCLQGKTTCSKERRFQVAAWAGGPGQGLKRGRPTGLQCRSWLRRPQLSSRDNIWDGKKIKNFRDQDRENVRKKRRTQHPAEEGPRSRSTTERWPEAFARALNEWAGQPRADRLCGDDS